MGTRRDGVGDPKKAEALHSCSSAATGADMPAPKRAKTSGAECKTIHTHIYIYIYACIYIYIYIQVGFRGLGV